MSPKTKDLRIWIVVGTVCLVLGGGQLWAGESPWYVAARFGDSRVDATLGDRHPQRIDDEAGAAAVEVGYVVNRYLAVELGYLDLGSHGGFGSPCVQTDVNCPERLALELCVQGTECAEILSALEADVDGFSLALVPSWPISDRFIVRGKAGLIAWDADVTAGRILVIRSTSGIREPRSGELFSSSDLLAGLGVHYSFPNGIGLLLQHDTFDLDAGSTTLGVSWRF